jgi:MFS family permease
MALHPRDAALLLAGRAVRTFCLGALSLALPLALKARGVGPSGLGALLTATLVEDAVVTVAVTALAPRWGRRRLLILSALPMVLGGVVLLLPGLPMGILALAVVLAVVSPSGQEAGPFSPLEQAALPDAVPPSRQTRAFAWYNVAGFLPAATGVLAAGSWIRLAGATGMGPEEALRTVFGVYAAGGAVLAVLYAGLSRPAAGTGVATSAASLRHLGLSGSRSIVFQLALLQGLDSLAGGFVVQSLLVWWFDLRFGVGPEGLGPLFFGTQALSALSFLAAPRVVDRIGLLNTMVFTHLLSNVLLAGVAFMPTFPLAVAALLARHLFSQMDVPTRQSYTMALVAPEERAPAAGLLTAARGLAQAVSPVLTGVALARAALGVPFLLAGGLKIVYDLVLYFRLRRVPLRAAVDRTAER